MSNLNIENLQIKEIKIHKFYVISHLRVLPESELNPAAVAIKIGELFNKENDEEILKKILNIIKESISPKIAFCLIDNFGVKEKAINAAKKFSKKYNRPVSVLPGGCYEIFPPQNSVIRQVGKFQNKKDEDNFMNGYLKQEREKHIQAKKELDERVNATPKVPINPKPIPKDEKIKTFKTTIKNDKLMSLPPLLTEEQVNIEEIKQLDAEPLKHILE